MRSELDIIMSDHSERVSGKTVCMSNKYIDSIYAIFLYEKPNVFGYYLRNNIKGQMARLKSLPVILPFTQFVQQ